MKTNLDALFKTSKHLEEDGVWFDLSETLGFKVRRFNIQSARVQKAMELKYKPHARQVQLGTMPIEQQRKILIEVFCEASLIDWKGVEIDGKDTPFSAKAAVDLMIQLPELFNTLIKHAEDIDNYREHLGNS